MNLRPLHWESSALTTRPSLSIRKEPLLKTKTSYISKSTKMSFEVVFRKNHQQSRIVSPNEILRKLVTVKQAVFTQFRFLFETKTCMTFLEKLTRAWSCSFEPPSSLPSTSSELNCLKIYLKEVWGYLSFVLENPNPVSRKRKPNYLHLSTWALQVTLFWNFTWLWLLMLLIDVFQTPLWPPVQSLRLAYISSLSIP